MDHEVRIHKHLGYLPKNAVHRHEREEPTNQVQAYDAQIITSPRGPATSLIRSGLRSQAEVVTAKFISGRTELIQSKIDARNFSGHQNDPVIPPTKLPGESEDYVRTRRTNYHMRSILKEAPEALGSQFEMEDELVDGDDSNGGLDPNSLFLSPTALVVKSCPEQTALEAAEQAAESVQENQGQAPSHDRENNKTQKDRPRVQQGFYEVSRASLEDDDSSTTITQPLTSNTLDSGTDAFEEQIYSQVSSAGKNILMTSNSGETNTPVVHTPSSDHGFDFREIGQDDTARTPMNTANPPGLTTAYPSSLGFGGVELPNAISHGFHQVVHNVLMVLGLLESTIPPNSRRIRWTCVSRTCEVIGK